MEKITCDTKHMAAVTGEWVRRTQTKIGFSLVSLVPFLDYDEAQYRSLKLHVSESKKRMRLRNRKERKVEDCVLSEMQAMRENPSLCCIIMLDFDFFFAWCWIASTNPTDLLGVWVEHEESGSSQHLYVYVFMFSKSEKLLLSSYSAVCFHAFPCF